MIDDLPTADRTRRMFIALGVGGLMVAGVAALLLWGTPPPAPMVSAGAPARQAAQTEAAYVESASIATGFAEPTSITTDGEGNIYVAGDGAVRLFDREGREVSILAVEGKPTCIATDGTRVYLGFIDHVEVYTREGAREARWPSPGEKAYLTSIALGREEVWVADAGRRVLLRCSPAGEVVAQVGKKDAARGVPGLVVPSPFLDVAVAADGVVWVANPGRHQLEAYTREGALLRSWGTPGFADERFAGCCNPAQFALLPDGGFVTGEKGLLRVKTYRADGTYAAMVAGTDAFPRPVPSLDVAVDPEGRILVLDPSVGAVRVFIRRNEETHGEK